MRVANGSGEPNSANRLHRRRLLTLGAGLASGAWAALAAGTEATGQEWRPWAATRKVPPLALPGLHGGLWRLQDQLGKVVLLNFWATWCGPCRSELPSLIQLAQRHAAQGLVWAAVNHRESPATIQRFLAEEQLALPVLLDADGSASKAWTPMVFPSTVALG